MENLEKLHSEIRRVSEIQKSNDLSPSEMEIILNDSVAELEGRVKQISSEFSDFSSLGLEELDAYLEIAKEELSLFESEEYNLSNKIGDLTRIYEDDSIKLENDLEELNNALMLVESHGLDKLQYGYCSESSLSTKSLVNEHKLYKFETLELDDQIEKTKVTLDSLQDLDSILKRVEAVQQIEDTLTGHKVIQFEGNHIRLSMKTFIPSLEVLLSQQKMEFGSEPSAVDHVLSLEVVDGTLELKKVEISPNNVFIGGILDDMKSLRLLPAYSMSEFRSSLEWFVRKVRNQITLCWLREKLVKEASISRHLFEYSDKDETIKVHVVGGIDAFIKIPHDWPILNSPLKLISLKNSNDVSKGISLSFLCKVEELVNSLDIQTRQNLSSFANAIEEILVQQMRSELQSDCISQQ